MRPQSPEATPGVAVAGILLDLKPGKLGTVTGLLADSGIRVKLNILQDVPGPLGGRQPPPVVNKGPATKEPKGKSGGITSGLGYGVPFLLQLQTGRWGSRGLGSLSAPAGRYPDFGPGDHSDGLFRRLIVPVTGTGSRARQGL